MMSVPCKVAFTVCATTILHRSMQMGAMFPLHLSFPLFVKKNILVPERDVQYFDQISNQIKWLIFKQNCWAIKKISEMKMSITEGRVNSRRCHCPWHLKGGRHQDSATISNVSNGCEKWKQIPSCGGGWNKGFQGLTCFEKMKKHPAKNIIKNELHMNLKMNIKL